MGKDWSSVWAKAIMDDLKIGRGSCSTVDENYTEGDLRRLLIQWGVRTKREAFILARRINRSERRV